MAEAFQCDGCDELIADQPAAVIVLDRSVMLNDAEFTDHDPELCVECLTTAAEAVWREMPDPSDTTWGQDEASNGDREWQVDATKCGNCGQRYPADYSRCDQCGTPNQEV